MPYNPSYHWVFVVFDVGKKEVFYVDPMQSRLETDLEQLLKMLQNKISQNWSVVILC